MKSKKTTKIVSSKKYAVRGVSKVVIIAIVAIVLIIGGGVYFLTQKAGNNPLASIVGGAKLSSECKHKDPDLCKFLNNASSRDTFSMTSKIKMDGMEMESLYEISGSEKFHMKSSQNGKEISNTITIGDTTYTLDYSDNTWWKTAYKEEVIEENSESEQEMMKDEFEFKDEDDTASYKFIAKEECRGLNCFKYEVIDPNMSDSKQFIWFDDRDYLIRKVVVEGSDVGSSESIYSYEGISISAPSPTKEGSMEDAASTSGYSEEDVKMMMQQYQSDSQNEEYEVQVDESAVEEY